MSERLVEGEEAHSTAQHLLAVLGRAIVATARGEWADVHDYAVDAVMLAERLAATPPNRRNT